MRFLSVIAALAASIILASTYAVSEEIPDAAPDAAVESAADAEAPKPVADTSIEEMTDGIVGMFPRAEGRVLTSGDKSVRVGIGTKDGLKPGMTVYLTRVGGPILHPVTKVVLGYRDTDLAVGVAEDVSESEAVVGITELFATQVAEGDTARLPTVKKSLLVGILGKDYNELVVDGVLRRLRDSNRFKISGPSEMDPAMLDDETFLPGLAKESGAEYVLLISTAPTMGQGLTESTLRLVSASGETAYESSGTVGVTYEVFDENLMGVPLVRGERRDYFRIEDLPYRGVHMTSGDVNGDGRPEILVTDGKDIYVYRFADGILRLIWTHRGISGDDHLDLEAADMNGNGRAEIYVTNYQRGRMASFVVEYDGNAFNQVFGPSPLMFRVLDMPDGKKRLLTTTVGANSPYSGIINEYAWKDGTLELVGSAGLPDVIKDPYGFAIADVVPEKDKLTYDPSKPEPEPEPEIVWVTDYDYLQVLDIDDGERIWESPERYGGYDTFFEPEKQDYILPNVDPRGKLKGRLIVRDAPDGRKCIVLTKNLPMTYITRRFRGYSGAEIYALAWDGTDMSELWHIRPIKGYLADITVGEVMVERRDDILILTEPTFTLEKSGRQLPISSVGSITDLFEESSSLLVFKIPMR